MSTKYASPQELRDIAILMDGMQKTTDRLRKRELSVNLGTISLFSNEGKLLGYMDPTEGEYTFTSAIDEMHADPVATTTGAITLPSAQRAMEMAESQPTELHSRREALHGETPLAFSSDEHAMDSIRHPEGSR